MSDFDLEDSPRGGEDNFKQPHPYMDTTSELTLSSNTQATSDQLMASIRLRLSNMQERLETFQSLVAPKDGLDFIDSVDSESVGPNGQEVTDQLDDSRLEGEEVQDGKSDSLLMDQSLEFEEILTVSSPEIPEDEATLPDHQDMVEESNPRTDRNNDLETIFEPSHSSYTDSSAVSPQAALSKKISKGSPYKKSNFQSSIQSALPPFRGNSSQSSSDYSNQRIDIGPKELSERDPKLKQIFNKLSSEEVQLLLTSLQHQADASSQHSKKSRSSRRSKQSKRSKASNKRSGASSSNLGSDIKPPGALPFEKNPAASVHDSPQQKWDKEETRPSCPQVPRLKLNELLDKNESPPFEMSLKPMMLTSKQNKLVESTGQGSQLHQSRRESPLSELEPSKEVEKPLQDEPEEGKSIESVEQTEVAQQQLLLQELEQPPVAEAEETKEALEALGNEGNQYSSPTRPRSPSQHKSCPDLSTNSIKPSPSSEIPDKPVEEQFDLNFDENKLVVQIILSQSLMAAEGSTPRPAQDEQDEEFGGEITVPLAELKAKLFKKKKFCKLDCYFIYWDMKLKKFKKIYDKIRSEKDRREKQEKDYPLQKQPAVVREENEDEDGEQTGALPTEEATFKYTSVEMIHLKKAKNFIETQLKLEFNTNRKTFNLVMQCLETNSYPFGKMKLQQKQDFDLFMTRYVIDEDFFKKGSKYYRMEDIFHQQMPSLSKYQWKADSAGQRVRKTWKSLGPVQAMKDKVGHKYSKILTKFLKDLAEVELIKMTEKEAAELNGTNKGSEVTNKVNKVEEPQNEKKTTSLVELPPSMMKPDPLGLTAPGTVPGEHPSLDDQEASRKTMYQLFGDFFNRARAQTAKTTTAELPKAEASAAVEEQLEVQEEAEEKSYQYFRAKRFNFPNTYQSFDKKHNCLRLIDFDFLATDPAVMKDLDIITFLHYNNYEKKESGSSKKRVPSKSPTTPTNPPKIKGKPLGKIIERKQGQPPEEQNLKKGAKLIRWSSLRPFLKGIGRRTWFLNHFKRTGEADRKFESSFHINEGILTNELISSRQQMNIIVGLYEGLLDESIDFSPTNGCLMFGRNIFSHYSKSYYVGYVCGVDRHTKGILVRSGSVFQQGFFQENRVDPENAYEIVDLLYNFNLREREERLAKKIMLKLITLGKDFKDGAAIFNSFLSYSEHPKVAAIQNEEDSEVLFVSVSAADDLSALDYSKSRVMESATKLQRHRSLMDQDPKSQYRSQAKPKSNRDDFLAFDDPKIEPFDKSHLRQKQLKRYIKNFKEDPASLASVEEKKEPTRIDLAESLDMGLLDQSSSALNDAESSSVGSYSRPSSVFAFQQEQALRKTKPKSYDSENESEDEQALPQEEPQRCAIF